MTAIRAAAKLVGFTKLVGLTKAASQGLTDIATEWQEKILDVAVKAGIRPHEPFNIVLSSSEGYSVERSPDGLVHYVLTPWISADSGAAREEEAVKPLWPPVGTDLRYIVCALLPEVEGHMMNAGRHYGLDGHHELGIRGQYADMYRKWMLLKRFMWEGEQPTRESLREILMDLIGHSLLTIAMIDDKDNTKEG